MSPRNMENIETPPTRITMVASLSASDLGWISPKPTVERVVNE